MSRIEETIVYSCPAYDAIEKRVDSLTGLPYLKDGDTLFLEGKRRIYSIGSVVSSALRMNRDPIAEYENAVAKGHERYFINACATTISANKEKREKHYVIRVGEEIVFEGKVLRVEKAGNDNLKLVEIGTRDEYIEYV